MHISLIWFHLNRVKQKWVINDIYFSYSVATTAYSKTYNTIVMHEASFKLFKYHVSWIRGPEWKMVRFRIKYQSDEAAGRSTLPTSKCHKCSNVPLVYITVTAYTCASVRTVCTASGTYPALDVWPYSACHLCTVQTFIQITIVFSLFHQDRGEIVQLESSLNFFFK